MRLLHTSDWHLGQTLHQFERAYEHQRFLDWLLDRLEDEAIDALLIAGDVFDNSNPSAAAQAQFYRFLTEAKRRVPHLNIVVIAGNHDSPGRLEAPTPFLELLGAHVVGRVARAGGEVVGHADNEAGKLAGAGGGGGAEEAEASSEASAAFEAFEAFDCDRLVVPLSDRDGRLAAWCIAMPFLRPGDVPRLVAADAGGAPAAPADSSDPYPAGVAALYARAMAVACARRRPGQAIVALGHCHLASGLTSQESERRIVVGGAEALSAGVFDPAIAYVALGHLHLAQKVGGDATRRYSGSPLPLSFAEVNYPHQVVVVDLAGEAVAGIRELRVPRGVELLRVPANPAPLAAVLAQLAQLAALDLPRRAPEQWPYLQVRVLLTQPEPTLRARIEAAIADQPLRLARIETSYARGDGRDDGLEDGRSPPLSIDRLDALEPAEFFARLYRHRYGDDVPEALLAAFGELLLDGAANGETSAEANGAAA